MHCTLYVHAQCKFIYIFMYYTAICILPCVTLCEHGVNTTVWTCICELFLQCIVPCMCIYNWCLSTFSFTTLPLAYVNIVWTLLCEHPSVNIFFKHIVPCMCMYMYCTVTWILTCVSICYHVAKCVNVLTCMYACMSMYIMTVCLIIKELVTKVKVSRSPCMYPCVLTLP